MNGVLAAEPAVLAHLQPVGIIFLVLHGVIVALLALGAGQGNFNSHFGTSYEFGSFFASLQGPFPPSSR